MAHPARTGSTARGVRGVRTRAVRRQRFLSPDPGGPTVTARYRAAIVGCGDIGHAHAEGYRANPDVELVAVVDPVEPARRQFQAEYGADRAYSSVEELF